MDYKISTFSCLVKSLLLITQLNRWDFQFYWKMLCTFIVFSFHSYCEICFLPKSQECSLFVLIWFDSYHGMLPREFFCNKTSFWNTRISGRYAPLILAPGESFSLEPCPLGILHYLWLILLNIMNLFSLLCLCKWMLVKALKLKKFTICAIISINIVWNNI